MIDGWSSGEKKALVGTVLFVLAIVPFLRSITFDAINFDDYPYTLNNPFVVNGLTWNGVKYAFAGTRTLGVWFPLTMLSYQTDVVIAGATAQTFHLSGLLWHGAATVALFLLICEVVAQRFQDGPVLQGIIISAVMALCWAVHPQRVESVVWIASRKDLVSGFFAFLSLWAYLKTQPAEMTGPVAAVPVKLRGEIFIWLFFLLAIMGKPSVMTLPLAMGCEEWLVRRQVSWKRLVVPFVMAVGCAILAVFMQTDVELFSPGTGHLPLWDRCITSLASIFYYVKTLFFPGALSLFYPWPRDLEYGRALVGMGILCVLLIVAAKTYVQWQTNRTKSGKVWGDVACIGLWFLGTLAPMLSLFMFGMHARADRFSYLPCVAVAVGMAVLLMSLRKTWLVTVFVLGVCFLYGVKAYNETWFWENSVSVFERAVAVTQDNAKAYCMLASAYTMDQNRVPEARDALRKSVALRPNSENLGLLAFLLCSNATPEEQAESIIFARQALQLNVNEKSALAALGAYALQKGEWREAESFLLRSLQNQNEPQPVILEWLGLAKFNQKKYKEALEAFEQAASVPRFLTPVLQERITLARQKSQQLKEGKK